MKICLVSRYFTLENAGIGRVGSEIYTELTKRGHDVRKIHDGKSLYSYFFYTAIRLPFLLPRNMDAYHAVTPMEALHLPADKTIVTFHDLFQITDPDKLGSGLGYSRWKRAIGTRYFRLVAQVAVNSLHVVAVSDKTRQELVDVFNVDPADVTVIRSGIRDDLRPMPKKDEIFRIGYLGQLDRRKRVNLLVDAFKKSDVEELVIGGIGVDEPRLKELAANNSRIKFLGRVPDDALVDFYNSLDVFIFPTWIEGYGLPIVEAMACKKPVIVLLDAKIPDEVKNRCIIVDQLDYVLGNLTYLRGLCKAVDIEDNYRWAKSHSWKAAVDAYEKLYKNVC